MYPLQICIMMARSSALVAPEAPDSVVTVFLCCCQYGPTRARVLVVLRLIWSKRATKDTRNRCHHTSLPEDLLRMRPDRCVRFDFELTVSPKLKPIGCHGFQRMDGVTDNTLHDGFPTAARFGKLPFGLLQKRYKNLA